MGGILSKQEKGMQALAHIVLIIFPYVSLCHSGS